MADQRRAFLNVTQFPTDCDLRQHTNKRGRRPALTYAFRVRGARSTHVPPVSAPPSQARAPRAQQPAQVRSRLPLATSLATRTALLSGVDVCLDLRKCSVGVGLAYSLATRSRNERPQNARIRPVTCGNVSRLSESN
jgi:hypothetical protein